MTKVKNLSIFLFLVLLLLILLGFLVCYYLFDNKKCTSCFEQKINQKDSAIIGMNVREMIKHKIAPFQYGYYDSLDIHIRQILQSPDSLKMIVVLGVQRRFVTDNPFQASSLVGIRKDRKSKWIFYEFSGVKVNWTTMLGATDNMCCALYNHLRGQSISVPEYHFDYTPLEKEFWYSIPFQKGFDVDTLFNCQVEYDFDLGKRTKIRPFVELNYPDSLIQ